MTTGSLFRRARTLSLLAFCSVVAGAALLRPTGEWSSSLAAALPPFLIYRHHQVTRWRRFGLLATAVLLAGLGSHLLGMVARATAWAPPQTARTWAHYILPAVGHLLSVLAGVLVRGPPLEIGNSPVRAQYLEVVCARTPGMGLRVARGSAGLRAPRWHPFDLASSFQTPWGPLPLHPESSNAGMGRAVKRSLDLLLCLALLPFLVLGTLAGAAVVRIGSGPPVFYTQVRLTRGGRSFRILKLRTMVCDAEPDGVPIWPEENDPRITAPGRWLRRFWIDELPQAWNVLRGELSWVGPRPERPHFVQGFEARVPNYGLRHQVLAGITGLAQVLGFTGNTSIPGRLRSDLVYLRRWTPFLDGRILLATLGRALLRPPIRKPPARAQRQEHDSGGSSHRRRSHPQPLSARDQHDRSSDGGGGDRSGSTDRVRGP